MRVAALTGLRGVAALWVVLVHCELYARALGMPWLKGFPIIRAGWHAVDLFFVLSGFVLMLTHAQDFKVLKAERVVAFLKVRAARVYPLSWVILLLIALVAWCDPGMVDFYRTLDPEAFTLMPFIKTTLLTTRWGLPGGDGVWNQQVWSLSVEIIGYVLFPVIAWRLMQRPAFWRALCFAFGCLGLLALSQVISGTAGMNAIDFRSAIERMALGFFAGVALAQCLMLCPDWLRRVCPALALASCVAILVISGIHRMEWAMTGCFAVLIYAVAAKDSMVRSLLGLPVVLRLGRVSFPLYLVHFAPLHWLVYQLRGRDVSEWVAPLITLAYIAVCLALAWVLHVAVEVPCHRWGRRWASHGAAGAALGSVAGGK